MASPPHKRSPFERQNVPPELCVIVTPNSAFGSENGVEFLGPSRYRPRSPFESSPTINSPSATTEMIDGIDLLPKEMADLFTARICCSDAHHLWRSGERSEAFQALDEALELTPNDPELRLYYARCCIELGRYGEARHHLLKSDNDAWEPHYLYGIMFLDEKQLKDAQKALHHALKLFDSIPFAYHKNEKSVIYAALGDVYMERKEFQRAHEQYRSARMHDKRNPEYKDKIQRAQALCVQDPNFYANRQKPIISRRNLTKPSTRSRNGAVVGEMSKLQQVIARKSSITREVQRRGKQRSSSTKGDDNDVYQNSTSTSSGSFDQHPRHERLPSYHQRRYPPEPPPGHEESFKERPQSVRVKSRHTNSRRDHQRGDSLNIERMGRHIENRAQRVPTTEFAQVVTIDFSDHSFTSEDGSEESVPTPILFLASQSKSRRRPSDGSPDQLTRPDLKMVASDTPMESEHRLNDDEMAHHERMLNQTRPLEQRRESTTLRQHDQGDDISDSSFSDDYEPQVTARGNVVFVDDAPLVSPRQMPGYSRKMPGCPPPGAQTTSRVDHRDYNQQYPPHALPSSNRAPQSMRRVRSQRKHPFRDSQSSQSSRGEHPVWRDRNNRNRTLRGTSQRPHQHDPHTHMEHVVQPYHSPRSYHNEHHNPRQYNNQPQQINHQHAPMQSPHSYPPQPSRQLPPSPRHASPRRKQRQNRKGQQALRTLQNRFLPSHVPHSGSMEVSTRAKPPYENHTPSSADSDYSHPTAQSHVSHTPERKVQVRMSKKVKLRVGKQQPNPLRKGHSDASSGPLLPPPIPSGLLSQKSNGGFVGGLPPPNTDMRQSQAYDDPFYAQPVRYPSHYSTQPVSVVDSLYSDPFIPPPPRPQDAPSSEMPTRYPEQGRHMQYRNVPTNVVFNVG